jgi:anti-sigma regulatory factor (Ser/Thr protein kinase)
LCGEGRQLKHRALLYGSDEQLVEAMAPFVREGIARDEPVLVVLPERKARVLRDALAGDAGAVEFADAALWYDAPARALRTWAGRAAGHADARRLRAVAEISLVDAAPAVRREWMRYESIFNVALEAAPGSIACLYDERELPDDLLADARRTHPEILVGGSPVPSPDYLELPAFASLIDREELEPPAPGHRELEFTWNLEHVRACVEADALAAGVAPERVPEVVLAAHEVAANAVTHGGGSGLMRTWTEPDHFVCEIADDGAGIPDATVGYLDTTAGRGLWVTRQLTDIVEVRGRPSGTTVRLRVGR